eukprot:2494308-Rhodomonas_salina.1
MLLLRAVRYNPYQSPTNSTMHLHPYNAGYAPTSAAATARCQSSPSLSTLDPTARPSPTLDSDPRPDPRARPLRVTLSTLDPTHAP